MTKVGTVCIVDDDKVYRFTTQKYIEILGLADKVISFDDGEEALIFFKRCITDPCKFPEVILLDVNMPIMDGWDFLDEFRKVYDQIDKKVRLYMVSSSVDDRDKNRSMEYKVDDYIVKPITEEQLVELIKLS